jgi:hypothetical protein
VSASASLKNRLSMTGSVVQRTAAITKSGEATMRVVSFVILLLFSS